MHTGRQQGPLRCPASRVKQHPQTVHAGSQQRTLLPCGARFRQAGLSCFTNKHDTDLGCQALHSPEPPRRPCRSQSSDQSAQVPWPSVCCLHAARRERWETAVCKTRPRTRQVLRAGRAQHSTAAMRMAWWTGSAGPCTLCCLMPVVRLCNCKPAVLDQPLAPACAAAGDASWLQDQKRYIQVCRGMAARLASHGVRMQPLQGTGAHQQDVVVNALHARDAWSATQWGACGACQPHAAVQLRSSWRQQDVAQRQAAHQAELRCALAAYASASRKACRASPPCTRCQALCRLQGLWVPFMLPMSCAAAAGAVAAAEAASQSGAPTRGPLSPPW